MPSVTFANAGPVSWRCPPNVTSIQVECTGAGATALASESRGATARPAAGYGVPMAGGGEYAAETGLAVVPGVVYDGFVGAHGVAGGATTWGAGLVTANGARGRSGGTGSTNTVHHDGGNGGAAGTGGGGGGGSSGGPGGPGAAGAAGTSSAGGAGAIAPAGGGAGGHGGAPGKPGSNGVSPGGGGGGAGTAGTSRVLLTVPGGGGGDGVLRITWTLAAASYPVPAIPVFPAGYAPAGTDLDSWLADPFAFAESRVVARLRQAQAVQSVPATGAATVLGFDTVDEDPLGGWSAATLAWGPPPGFGGLYQVDVTVCTAALATTQTIEAGVSAPLVAQAAGSSHPGSSQGGASGTYWVWLAGGQDTVQATAYLLGGGSAVNTSIAAGLQSSMDITWLSA